MRSDCRGIGKNIRVAEPRILFVPPPTLRLSLSLFSLIGRGCVTTPAGSLTTFFPCYYDMQYFDIVHAAIAVGRCTAEITHHFK